MVATEPGIVQVCPHVWRSRSHEIGKHVGDPQRTLDDRRNEVADFHIFPVARIGTTNFLTSVFLIDACDSFRV